MYKVYPIHFRQKIASKAVFVYQSVSDTPPQSADFCQNLVNSVFFLKSVFDTPLPENPNLGVYLSIWCTGFPPPAGWVTRPGNRVQRPRTGPYNGGYLAENGVKTDFPCAV